MVPCFFGNGEILHDGSQIPFPVDRVVFYRLFLFTMPFSVLVVLFCVCFMHKLRAPLINRCSFCLSGNKAHRNYPWTLVEIQLDYIDVFFRFSIGFLYCKSVFLFYLTKKKSRNIYQKTKTILGKIYVLFQQKYLLPEPRIANQTASDHYKIWVLRDARTTTQNTIQLI